jgi:hypothetical protein
VKLTTEGQAIFTVDASQSRFDDEKMKKRIIEAKAFASGSKKNEEAAMLKELDDLFVKMTAPTSPTKTPTLDDVLEARARRAVDEGVDDDEDDEDDDAEEEEDDDDEYFFDLLGETPDKDKDKLADKLADL